ncbi:hypothetical protein MPSYJ_30240 [Mycolicibacterium psychrotolerans]|uniref:Uncharacterized protein n=1 Tax=Mycolicibacterium psychrotolerans TaxID=216929 RepID=A0A7I7MDG1_9MYCO|nr:hypothetical protein MPSYJ_30240 [Mycolicibacterium psychrotolerans]
MTFVQPTTTIANAATVPVAKAANRTRAALPQPISTVCRRYRPINGLGVLNATVHTRCCTWGRIGEGWNPPVHMKSEQTHSADRVRETA